MLNGCRILLVDDEPIISMALSYAITDANGHVVGPALNVRSALALATTQEITAAIMDVNLPDGIISPVVEYLVPRQVPIILLTGAGIPDDLAARFPSLVVWIKPASSDALVARIATLIKHRNIFSRL